MIKEPSLYVSLAVHREQVAELDQANTELNFTISQLEAEKMRLLEILAENEEYHLAIMTEKCPTDEVHCTCVPTLRAENKRLREALEAARGHVVSHCAQTAGIEYMTFVHMITKYPGSKPRIVEQIDAALDTTRELTARG
jgi:hypothetical protein